MPGFDSETVVEIAGAAKKLLHGENLETAGLRCFEDTRESGGTVAARALATAESNLPTITFNDHRDPALEGVAMFIDGIPVIKESPGAIAFMTPSVRNIFSQAKPSVLAVTGSDGGGTTFLASRDGLAVTAKHVVSGDATVNVDYNGESLPASVVFRHPTQDIAILQVSKPGKGAVFQPLQIESASIQPSAKALGMGYPLSDTVPLTASPGNFQSETTLKDGELLGQFIMRTFRGNSGGPILDEAGNVISMVVLGNDKLAGGVPGRIITQTLDLARPGWQQYT